MLAAILSVLMSLAGAAVSVGAALATRLAGGAVAASRWLARTLLASPHAAAGLLLGLGVAAFWFPGVGWYAAVGGLPLAAGLLLWHDSQGPTAVAAALAPKPTPASKVELL